MTLDLCDVPQIIFVMMNVEKKVALEEESQGPEVLRLTWHDDLHAPLASIFTTLTPRIAVPLETEP
jgi:hypothetical protein